MENENEESLRSQVEARLGRYYSWLQDRHKEQMAQVTKVRDHLDKATKRLDTARNQLDKAVSKMLKSHTAEEDEFRQMLRYVGILLAESESNSSDAESTAITDD